ncbi:MAG TPA: hypothetical protein VGW74_07160 [Propionibacteriaceae bacterium]|nr:hypothetical protein [Propionibacteriaceae bacterium]
MRAGQASDDHPPPPIDETEVATVRWPWSPEPQREVNHTAPLADGDVHLVPGWPRWADLLHAEPLHEATQPLPVISPLLTAGQRARTWRGFA